MGWMIYEYRCKICGIKFEAMVNLEKPLFVSMIDRPSDYIKPPDHYKPHCPECESLQVKRLLSPTYGIVK